MSKTEAFPDFCMSEFVLMTSFATYGLKCPKNKQICSNDLFCFIRLLQTVPTRPEMVADGFQMDLKPSVFLEGPKSLYDSF